MPVKLEFSTLLPGLDFVYSYSGGFFRLNRHFDGMGINPQGIADVEKFGMADLVTGHWPQRTTDDAVDFFPGESVVVKGVHWMTGFV